MTGVFRCVLTAPCRALLAATLLTCAPTSVLAAVEVTAEVNSNTIGMEDNIVLTVRVSGSGLLNSVSTPQLPAFSWARVAWGPSTSTSFRWVNGKTSGSKSYTWSLLPLEEGEFVIPPIEVTVDGSVHRSEPVTIHVVSSSPGARPPAPGGGAAGGAGGAPVAREPDQAGEGADAAGTGVLVLAEIDRTTLWVGQPAQITYRLLTQVPISRVSPEEWPPLTGFLTDDITVDPNETRRRVQYAGRAWDEYVLAQKMITPTEAGRKEIGPAVFTITASLPSQDIFGRFFGGRLRDLARRTQPLSLEVKPLPSAGRPSDFSGAVGSFSLSATADRNEAETGDAVGFTVRIQGTGDLRGASSPEIADLRDVKVYEPRVENNADVGSGVRRVTRTLQYVLVPLAPGEQRIPALRFSYFDPAKGSYETASTGPIVLQVARSAAQGPEVATVSRQEISPLRRDLHYLKPIEGALVVAKPPLYERGWYQGLLLLPLAAPFAVSMLRTRLASGATGRSRKRRASRIARRALAKAARESAAGRPVEFHDALGSAVVSSLAEAWGVSASGLTYGRIEGGLAERGVSRETREMARKILERCDSSRFAPASTKPEERLDLLEATRDLLRRIEREGGESVGAPEASGAGAVSR